MVPISKVGRILEAENSMWRMVAIVGESALIFPTAARTREMYDDSNWKLVLGDSLLNSGIQIRSTPILRDDDHSMGGGLRTDGTKDVRERVWERGRFWGYQIEIDPTERA